MVLSIFSAEPGGREIVIISVFDAPREHVFRAYTDPNLIPQWWGLEEHTTTVDTMDVRPGGVWRLVSRDSNGNEFAFKGVISLRSAPRSGLSERLNSKASQSCVAETATFEEHDGKTTVTATAVFQTVEDRDGMLQSEWSEGRPRLWIDLPNYCRN